MKPHLAPPMLGLHGTDFLRHQYPSTPQPLFPTYPRTVHKHGPLRSCRKIRGKAAVQQSPSRRARRSPSPRCRMWLVTSNKRSMKNDQNPATAHHTITTARRPDNIRSSILVRGRSIRSMARSGRQPRRQLARKDSHFRHFGGVL